MFRSDAGVAHRLSLSDAPFISENRPSQGETTTKEALLALVELARFALSPHPRIWVPTTASASPDDIYTRVKYTFVTGAKAFIVVPAIAVHVL